jgi:dTDP-4-dehydrorhamnose reductase
MRILLIGAGGQLAEDLLQFLPGAETVTASHAGLDIGDRAAVELLVEQVRPDCVINTAAFNLVDACEDQPQQAFTVNALGACHLARAAQGIGASLVHFSTNFVFDGAKGSPYVETDLPRPLSVYAMSKLAGEWFVRHYCEKHFLVRTAALYGRAGNRSKGGNFVERMIRLAEEGKPLRVVCDQVVNPTCARDLAERVGSLIQTNLYGLYHMVNSGECSWYEFAQEVFRLGGITPDLSPVSTVELGSKAKRPAYSGLDNAALRAIGLPEFRPWQVALADYMRRRHA